MRKQILVLSAALIGLSGCADQLDVKNVTQPDVQRVLGTPALIEGVIGGLALLNFNPQRASESVNTQSKVLAGEGWGSVANFGIAVRGSVPRSALISNELGNDNQTGNLANFSSFSISSRTAANAIQAFDKQLAAGKSLGTAAQDQRARAFAYMQLAIALGDLSLAYDSAAITTVKLDAQEIPPLSGAADVNKAALVFLDSAINIASSPVSVAGGSGGFPLPNTWYNGIALARTDFIRLARSFKARFRAGLARTPAERAAVDWASVIADATNGITADFAPSIGNGSGWSATFDENQGYVNGYNMMPMGYWGMADTSGAYDAWLATPLQQRHAFLVQTPDGRWPTGATRAAQQTITAFASLPTSTGQILRNRPTGEDIVVTGWGDTWYENRRYGAVNAAGHIGPYVEFSKVENDMLAAEGYLRTSNVPAAAALINVSRVRNGLSSVLSVTSATTPISTATSCVPRVPQAPSFNTAACGNLFEAMKYEKRVESAETGYMVWFTDSRGWGDLVENTVVEWPVPYQEMQARYPSAARPYYNGTRAQGKGTYGF